MLVCSAGETTSNEDMSAHPAVDSIHHRIGIEEHEAVPTRMGNPRATAQTAHSITLFSEPFLMLFDVSVVISIPLLSFMRGLPFYDVYWNNLNYVAEIVVDNQF